MDFRRYYGLRAPRPIGYSTYMVPQSENYSLFATPYVDLNKRLSKLVKGFKQSEMDTTTEEDVKRKESEDALMSTEENIEMDPSFGIVLNISTIKPGELSITKGEGNEIEVSVDQSNVQLKRMDITFSRKCIYKYQLPDNVDKNSLVALRTSDDYLIILQRNALRLDLFKESIKSVKELTESIDNDVVTHLEAESSDLEGEKSKSKKGSDSKETKSKGSDSKETKSKGSDSKESESMKGTKSKGSESKAPEPKGKVEAKTKKGSKSGDSGADTEEVEDDSLTESVFFSGNALNPVQVPRLLRPGLDIFILRKYMADLESYVSIGRKFIENASFITENSKTPELKLRAMAKEETEKHLERPKRPKTSREKEAEEHSEDSEVFEPTPGGSGQSGEIASDASNESTSPKTRKVKMANGHSVDSGISEPARGGSGKSEEIASDASKESNSSKTRKEKMAKEHSVDSGISEPTTGGAGKSEEMASDASNESSESSSNKSTQDIPKECLPRNLKVLDESPRRFVK